MEYFEEIQDRVILIGVQADRGDDMEESLDELGELAATAGAAVAGRIIQNREADGIAFHASNVRKRQYKKSTGIRRCLSENCHESNRRNSANTTLAALWF